MNKKMININIIISIIFLIIFLLVIKDIFLYEITSYDKWAFNLLKSIRSNEMTLFMTIITKLGDFLTVVSILLILLLLYKNKKTVYYIIINMISIFLLNDFLKHIIHRARPVGYNLINESSYSFPSSHTMCSTMLFSFLIYLVYKNVNNKILKYILMIILFIILVLICISRVYLGVHYLSDVIGGLSISIIYMMIFLVFNKDFEKKV